MSHDGFVRAATVDAVTDGIPLGIILPDGRRLCLVRDGAAIYAVDDRCPHRDFAMSGGDVIAPCVLECPWHGALFDVRTGAVLQGPATDAIATYPVRVTGNDIWVGPPSVT